MSSARQEGVPTGRSAVRSPPLTLPAARARRVLLLRAFETTRPESPLWTAADAEWASRLTAETLAPDAPPAQVLATRADHAMQRLEPRSEVARRLLAGDAPGGGLVLGVMLLAAGAGLLADRLTSGQQIDLLAPALWLLVGWNLVIYLAIAAASLRRGGGGAGAGGGLRPLLRRLWAPVADRRDAAFARYAADWAACMQPAFTARAALLLHGAAAALAAGLAGGLYLRGLVLDYRAGWQSTFLEPSFVHALLATLLAPAERLTGIAVPDAAAVAALRVLPGAPAAGPAAPWIHLQAATLAIFVVAPRLALAFGASVQAGWRAARCAVDGADAWAQGVLRRHARQHARVQVLSHVQAAPATAVLALRTLLVGPLGDDLELQVAPPVPYGDEESPPPAPAGTTLRVLLFDLGTTAEAEAQGRLVECCRRASPTTALLLVVDQAGCARRFASLPARLAERRESWQRFAAGLEVACATVDLEHPSTESLATALEAALAGAPGGARGGPR